MKLPRLRFSSWWALESRSSFSLEEEPRRTRVNNACTRWSDVHLLPVDGPGAEEAVEEQDDSVTPLLCKLT